MKILPSILLLTITLITASFAIYEDKDTSNLSVGGVNSISQNALFMPPNSDLTSLYSFTKVDTLQYSTGFNSHLAVIKEANGFVFLDAHGVEPNRYGEVANGGYQLRKIELVNGNYVQTKGVPVTTKFNSEHEPGYSKFMKTEDGYLAYSPESIVLFGNDLESKKILHHGQRTFISVAIIKGTTEIAVVSMLNSTRDVDINIYDYSTDEWITDFKVLMGDQTNNKMVPSANNLIQTSDGNLFITLKTSKDCTSQIFGKLDYSKLKAGAATNDFIIWQKLYPVEIMDMNLSPTGSMTALIRVYDEAGETDHLERVTANTSIATAGEFNASLNISKTSGSNQVLQWDHFANLLPNGEVIGCGIGLYEYGLQHSPVIIRYASNMSILGQYRIPTAIDSKLLDRSRDGYRPFSLGQTQHSLISSSENLRVYGLPYLDTRNIKDDHELFIQTYMGKQAVYQFLPGATKDEMYIMTANALLKVNFNNYTPCTVRWETRAEADRNYAAVYGSSDDDTPTTQSTNTSTTSQAQNTPAKNTKILIKNDLTEAQNTKYGSVKLVFDGGSRVTTTIQRGHTLEIDCEDVKGVHVGNEQNTAPGKLLFKTSGNCGKTLNLSSYW